jgi:hypothetical protein
MLYSFDRTLSVRYDSTTKLLPTQDNEPNTQTFPEADSNAQPVLKNCIQNRATIILSVQTGHLEW